jgi:hypothetical protein
MTVDDWVFEAVDEARSTGATVREIQRRIDERHYEELALDTIETSLASLGRAGRVQETSGRWHAVHRTTKEDALRRLFGDE